MTIRARIAQALLFTNIVVWAIWLGGQVFNAGSFVRQWSGNLPDSLIGWNERAAITFPETAGQAAFFSMWGNFLILFTVATLVANWKLRARRPWLIGATVLLLIIAGFIVFMVTEQGKLTSAGNFGIVGAELVARANTWVLLNHVRIGIETLGLLVLLRALSIPPVERAATSYTDNPAA